MKILLTTDGSRYALAAARAVTGWIPSLDATVDVLAVIPRRHSSMHVPALSARPHSKKGLGASSGHKRMHSGSTPTRELVLEWRGAAGRWLQSTTSVLEGHGLRVREIVRTGDPAEIALEQLASAPYDMIVVGAKGRGDVPFFRTGSVALAVLERSPVPVMLVRARSTRRRSPTPEHPLRVLLAVDAGGEAQRAAEQCARLFGSPAARASVLVVAAGESEKGIGRRKAAVLARTTAERVRARGLDAEPLVLESGSPSERIREAARDADLVVLGARSAGRDHERPLGSVSLEVARAAPCSVLVVRGTTPAEGGRRGRTAPAAKTAESDVEIAYRAVPASALVEKHALRAAAGLEKVAPDLTRSRVTIGRSNGRHRKGNQYDVRLELEAPGRRVTVSRTPSEHAEDQNVLTAIDEAYAKGRRALVEARRQTKRKGA